jgi:signal transduction histidine kinase
LPLLVTGAGLVLVWSRLGTAQRRQWISAGDRRETRIRTVIGVVMALMGLILLLSQGGGLARLRDVTVGVLVVLLGAGILGAPFIARFFDTLRTEQTERIRATEKADIAAHLHDSVLQTLALIQRRADDPQAVQLLARAQERELRCWMYGEHSPADATLATAAKEVASDIETLHGIPVDVVVTGDRALGEAGAALVRALREALANAVRHGAPPVSVYLEVGPAYAEAFVRDHGPGFDPADVPEDRLGVRESIFGRMKRHGGEAQVRRLDDGTEVRLRMPLTEPTASDEQPKDEDE